MEVEEIKKIDFISSKRKEDRVNNVDLQNVEVEVDENHPFIHPKEKMQALESEDSEKLKADERFSVTTIEIDEGE